MKQKLEEKIVIRYDRNCTSEKFQKINNVMSVREIVKIPLN